MSSIFVTVTNQSTLHHLEAVTHQINVLRGVSFASTNAAKTECKRRHSFTPENVKMQKGSRLCRECARIKGNERMQKWRDANRDHVRALARALYAANPEPRRDSARRCRAKKQSADPLPAPEASELAHTRPAETSQQRGPASGS